ncbi:MAG: NADH-quinone oxidoreductase subunit M [Chitinophagales bacterium]|nr:NADH-quinone oxidoreductase subunit M [Chitinophagales bacterium]MDW8419640.1 NADH-quinone oxidoreductase subunit M [Chitinophagales bacterium]
MLLHTTLFLPLAFALLSYLSGNRFSRIVSFVGSLLTLTSGVLLWYTFRKGGYEAIQISKAWISSPAISYALLLDGLSMALVGLTVVLVPLIILTTFKREVKRPAVFYGLLLLMQFGMLGVFVASDGFLYYIFWELALIPIYFIALIWGEGQDVSFRQRAIFKFFVYTLAGSLFMLIGFIYLYQHTGTFALQGLYQSKLDKAEQLWLFWAFFAAYAIKIPVFPFHTWQPDTYREAPGPGTMLLSGIMLKMGLYSMMRWLLPVLPQGVEFWTPYVIVLCVVGVIYGSVIAIRQDDLKKLFAYSSFAHVGLIAAGIFTLTREGMQGAVVQMIAHGVNVVALFFAAEIILQRTGTLNIARLGGIRHIAPRFATALMITVLASVALPGTNAFIGEFLLLVSAYTYNKWLAAAAGLTVILGAVYMLRMYQRVMLGDTTADTNNFTDLGKTETIVFAVIIVFIFLFGLFPSPILNMLENSVDMILALSFRTAL